MSADLVTQLRKDAQAQRDRAPEGATVWIADRFDQAADEIALLRLTDAERTFLQDLRGAYEELAKQSGYVNAAAQKEASVHADLLSGLLNRAGGAQ